MRISQIITFITVIVTSTAYGQFNETIRTARPGQAIGAFSVGHGLFQIQSGFDYFGSNDSNTNSETEGFLNNTVVRFGLTEPFEVSALLEYSTLTTTNETGETKLQGFNAVDIGMRYHIHDGHGLIPNVGFQIRARLPVLGEDFEIKDLAPRFILATSQQLSENFTLITNWGATWNGNNSSPTGTYVINLSFPFNDKFGAYVETYGGIHQGEFTIHYDTGIAWLISNDLQLDLYGGYGDNQGISSYFVSTGVSWRTKRKEVK